MNEMNELPEMTEQELVDRGYTELSPGSWAYEDDPTNTLTCTD